MFVESYKIVAPKRFETFIEDLALKKARPLLKLTMPPFAKRICAII